MNLGDILGAVVGITVGGLLILMLWALSGSGHDPEE